MFGWLYKFSQHPSGVWVWVRKEGARGREPKGALVNKNWTEKMKICTIKTKTQTESERE